MTTEEQIAEAETLGYECRLQDDLLICDHPSGARVGVTAGYDFSDLYGAGWWRHDLLRKLRETSQ